MLRGWPARIRSTSLEWWHVRDMKDWAASIMPTLDAETLKRLHRFGERERQGLNPLLWHQRLRAAIVEPLRRMFRF